MKSFKLCLAALLLCLSLCACQGGADSAAETTAATEPATEAETEPPAGAPVVVGKEETFSYTDKQNGAQNATYKLPSLQFSTPDAQRINREIEEQYAAVFETAAQEQSSQAALSVTSLDYDANVNDDVASVVIKTETQAHTVSYTVYNFNIATGNQLYNAGLLSYLQLDYDQTFASLKEALEDDYYSKFKVENFPDDYYYQLDRTTNSDALQQSQLFLNSDGILYAVCTEYAGVGAGEFQVLLKVYTNLH